MVTGGLSNHDVLRMATIYGAEAIGMGQDLGSMSLPAWRTLRWLSVRRGMQESE